MRYLDHGLLPVFAVALALIGPGALAQQPGPPLPGVVPGAATTDASVEPLHEARLAAAASVELPQGGRPADNWPNLNALQVNVYGLSYHPDRKTIHRLHLDNEVNPGLGLHYTLDDDARGVTFAEVGAYHDSGRNWAKFAALGYQFKWGQHWRIGGALAAMNSRTYNGGTGFIAMIPLVSYDFGSFKLNAVYLPKFGHYNEVAAYGFYLSIPFRK